jgi:hypothetical protein
VLAVALCVIPSTSSAVPINYGSFMGTTVSYEMVREDSNSGDVPPLFGPPTTVGPVTPGFPAVPCVMCGIPNDSLDFNPVGFGASTTNGGVDITDGNLAFMVRAKPNQSIANLTIEEFGDVTLAGIAALGSQTTFASVSTSVFIDIVEINGIGINPIKLQKSLSFSPSGGTYGLGTDGGGGPIYSDLWNGSLLVNFVQELADLNIPGVVTKINVNLDNTLVAISQTGTTALIAKKDHIIIKTNIPEPTSCVLAMLSLVAGLAVSRRGR